PSGAKRSPGESVKKTVCLRSPWREPWGACHILERTGNWCYAECARERLQYVAHERSAIRGGMAEWSNAAVLKTAVRKDRGLATPLLPQKKKTGLTNIAGRPQSFNLRLLPHPLHQPAASTPIYTNSCAAFFHPVVTRGVARGGHYHASTAARNTASRSPTK